ncbi:MAG: arylsulfatase [Planctomycetes bacterium]|nr:arylsulfatase [Planctomycetota bacterium]
MNLRFLALIVGLMIPISGLQAADAPRPNILFLLIDDLGYSDCGFNGGRVIHTPHIDALAAGGTVLESHYVQPVCSPTRAALMTGRYATRTGVYTVVRPHAKWGLPLEERTLATALREVGYETAITGKWHLGEYDRAYLPTNRGFDHQYGHYFGALDYFTKLRDGSYDWHRDDQELKEEGYTTELIASEVCRRIAAKDRARSLFLYVPFNAVHSPMQVPDRYLEPYGALKGGRRQLAGMLAAVDEAIGKIVSALEQANLRDNTLIVFSSDNGGPQPGINAPLKGFKGSIHEGGVRGCAFANWPGKIPAGKRITQPMHIIDWYPTLVKLAGGSLDQKHPIDGKDVWPMLTQNAPSPHDAILSVQSPTRAALRMGDWKLVSNGDGDEPASNRANKQAKPKTEPLALYNLASDIGETTNLAKQDPARVAAMQARLAELLKDAVPPGNER